MARPLPSSTPARTALPSLLAMGVGTRLVIAAALIALLWLAVAWALGDVAAA